MVTTHHSDGSTDTHTTLEEALAALRDEYDDEIVWEGELSGRILVWEDAISAEADSGISAIAEIRADGSGPAWA